MKQQKNLVYVNHILKNKLQDFYNTFGKCPIVDDKFLKGSYNEFRNKVEWPKWNDLQSSTIVVTISTVILALFTFGIDSLFSKAISNIISVLINLFN